MTDTRSEPAEQRPQAVEAAWHAATGDAALAAFASTASGLASADAAARPAAPAAEAEQEGFLEELAESLREPLQLLLIAVGVLSAVFGEVSDAVAIFAVIVAVALTETISEWRAGRAIAALRSLSAPTARVLRDGVAAELPTARLVPGDVLLVEAGDLVAVDARVLAADGLRAEESSLTGEPVPVGKNAAPVPSGTHLAERSSMLYAGTAVVAGEGRALVVAVGGDTELGKLGRLVASEKEPPTPLQKSLSELARVILVFALAASVLVPLVGVAAGQPWRDMLLAGLVLAFATVPEELPLLVTVLLAVGGRRLAKRGALLRRLRAGEALGAVTTVITDKTGTLTENRLRLVEIRGDRHRVLATALAAGPDDAQGSREPLEAQFAAAAAGDGIGRPQPAVAVFAFDPQIKILSRTRTGEPGLLSSVSGAPEAVLARCVMTPADRADAQAELTELTGRGLRVIALADRSLNQVPADRAEAESDLCFVGFAAFADPLRAGVPQAVSELAGAGVATVVITGDHPDTAAAVAAQAGLPPGHLLLGGGGDDGDDGDDGLAAAGDEQVSAALVHGTVIARATPADKLRAVRLLQAGGQVVAVTGDGVNDAPALSGADVGIAMGRRGSDLARQAADLVLTDDAYPTVAAAVAAGRSIGSQLRRAVAFYLGAKLALVAVVLAALATGRPSLFTPAAIVVLELFMDLGASVAFVSEPEAPGAMRRPPHTPGSRFLGRTETAAIGTVAATLAVTVLPAYLICAHRYGEPVGRSAALLGWLAGHALIAWTLRARAGLSWSANPAFPIWASAATATGILLTTTGLGSFLHLSALPAIAVGIVAAAVGVGLCLAVAARARLRLSDRL